MRRFAVTYMRMVSGIIEAVSMEAAERQAKNLLTEDDKIHSIREIKDDAAPNSN